MKSVIRITDYTKHFASMHQFPKHSHNTSASVFPQIQSDYESSTQGTLQLQPVLPKPYLMQWVSSHPQKQHGKYNLEGGFYYPRREELLKTAHCHEIMGLEKGMG